MKNRLIAVAMSFIMSVAYAIPTHAQGYIYIDQDPSRQVLGQPHRTFKFYKWYWYADLQNSPYRPLKWATTNPGALNGPATTAFGRWASVNSTLGIEWHEDANVTGTGQTPDLQIHLSACPGAPSWVACFARTSYYWMWSHGTSPWTTAEIWIHPSWGDRETTITHELGHALALNDRYAPSGCHSDDTVMDKYGCMNGYPTWLDQTRMQYYYGTGARYVPLSWWRSGQHLKANWKDEAWADRYMVIEYFKSEWWGWQEVDEKWEYTNIGAAFESLPIYLTTSWYQWVGPGTYIACAKPLMGRKDNGQLVYGGPVCTGQVTF